MRRRLAAFPVLLCLAAMGAPAQQSAKPPVARFTERDDGRLVRLPVGAELTVSLPEQAGAPYRWMMRDSDNIRRIGEPLLESGAPPGVTGGPTRRRFRLQVVAGGRTAVQFRLQPLARENGRVAPRRFELTIEADTMRYIPTDWGSDDRRLITVGERDANGIVLTDLGRPVEVHLSAEPGGGYRWEVLSSRNIAFERPIGVEYKPGLFGLGAGAETIVRLHTTVDRSDGFLELGWVPRGESASRSSDVRRLSFQFHNQR